MMNEEKNEAHLGEQVILWDVVKSLPPTIATDRICEALNKKGVKAEWMQIYLALTEPI